MQSADEHSVIPNERWMAGIEHWLAPSEQLASRVGAPVLSS
jgi:hypothetical protein